jgi:hypothetical protein
VRRRVGCVFLVKIPTLIDFAALMGPVARRLLGEPNARLSKPHDLRFGTNGSMSIRLRREGFLSDATPHGNVQPNGGGKDAKKIRRRLITAVPTAHRSIIQNLDDRRGELPPFPSRSTFSRLAGLGEECCSWCRNCRFPTSRACSNHSHKRPAATLAVKDERAITIRRAAFELPNCLVQEPSGIMTARKADITLPPRRTSRGKKARLNCVSAPRPGTKWSSAVTAPPFHGGRR